eukprot:COSAG02_NODE_3699_length_6364_cov_1.588132_3_plen_1223_part_00
MICAVGNLGTCLFVSSVYTVPRTVTCGHLGDVCLPGTAVKASALDIRAEVGSPEVQSTCCETSCAAWGLVNDCTSGVFISEGANTFPIGEDPQLACCTSPCAVGHVVDQHGRCELCPAGTAPDSSRITCVPCGSGSYVPAGSPECTACPAGKNDDDGSSTTPCTDCPAGMYTVTPGRCDGLCDSGTYAPSGSASATDCEDCASGQYDDDLRPDTPCGSCAAGSFSPDSVTCSACPVNRYSDKGAMECLDCPTGRVSDPQTAGRFGCECPTGLFSMPNECVSCMGGTQHVSHMPTCPYDDLMVEWHGASRYTPAGYPAGFYPSGRNRDTFGINPYLVYNTEVVLSEPRNGCGWNQGRMLVNAADIAGKVVLMRRGECDFQQKTKSAGQAGAVAVLIADHTWTPVGEEFGSTSTNGVSRAMSVGFIHRDLGYELEEAIVNSMSCTGTLDEVPGSCSDGSSTSEETCAAADCSGSACEWTGPVTPTCDLIMTPGVPANGPQETPTYPTAHCPPGCTVTFPDGPVTVSLNCGQSCPLGDLCGGVCFPCDPGSFDDDNDAATACSACPEGTYQPAAGAGECLACPFGQVSNAGAAACSTEPLYVGCFEDKFSIENGRDLAGGQFLLQRGQHPTTGEFFHTAVEECALRCAGYSYMGLQGALLCFCGNDYGTYQQLEDADCGSIGDLCADSDEDTCVMQNAVFQLPRWSCADVTCDAGTASLTSQASTSVLGQSLANQQAACCGISCAAWHHGSNTCGVPGSCSNDTFTTQETCEAADCSGIACEWTAPDASTRFMTRLSEVTAAGNDPRAVCCTEPCSAGYKNDGGRCEPCSAGTVSTETDTTTCSACAVGEYAPEGASTCSTCIEGQYDDDRSPITPCQQCSPGSFSSVAGATSCDGVCPAGKFGPSGSSNAEGCVECAPGQYDHDSDSGTRCLLCLPGRFADAPGQLECDSCPTGQMSAGGSTTCTVTEDSYAASACPLQWTACSQSASCTTALPEARAALAAPSSGSEELLALLRCLSEAAAAEVSPSGGCLDPWASNYDATKVVDDGSCIYECAVLSPSVDNASSVCRAYSIETMAWTSQGTAQRAADSFTEQLAAAERAVVQGATMYDHPPEGSVDWRQYADTHPSELSGAALDAWLAQSPQAGCNYEWFNDPPLDWHAARDECISRGGNLASVHSAEDFEATRQAIVDGNGGQNTGFLEVTWIGANDERNEQGRSFHNLQY